MEAVAIQQYRHEDNNCNGRLNSSEKARQRLTPQVAKIICGNERVGHEIESVFTKFWQLARRADDMMDYSNSSDLKWLQVIGHLFQLCSESHHQHLPSSPVSAAAWLKALSRFFQLMSATCKGEVEDLLLADNNPSELDYRRMVLAKTSPWFTGRIVCAAIAATTDNHSDSNKIPGDLIEYGNLTSLAYQIRNDTLDAKTEGKDIKIGKLSYPAIVMSRKSCSIEYAIQLSTKAASEYEDSAREIGGRYGRSLELLTHQLCSSTI